MNSNMETQCLCSICGFRGPFGHEAGAASRDNYRCQKCKSMVRQRDVAQIILDEFGAGKYLDITALVRSGLMNNLSVYDVGIRGPLTSRLKDLPNYVQSYFWDEIEPGQLHNGIRCEDLRNLTFSDAVFDLIVSQEVFEHVFEPEKALAEIYRVLRPGGLHIFSIPVRYPIPDRSVNRASLFEGQVVNHAPATFHIAGDGSESLVVTEWGQDIIDAHAMAKLRLSIVRRSSPRIPDFHNATFVARKLA